MNFLGYYLPREIINIIVSMADLNSTINLSSINLEHKQFLFQLLNIQNRFDKLEYIYLHSNFEYHKSSNHKWKLLKFAKSPKESVIIGTSTKKLRFLLHESARIFGFHSEKVQLGTRKEKTKSYIDVRRNCRCNPSSCYHLCYKHLPKDIYGVKLWK